MLNIKDILLHMGWSGFETKLVWVPGHEKVEGNLVADTLAKRAITMGEMHGRKASYLNFVSEIERLTNKVWYESMEKRLEKSKKKVILKNLIYVSKQNIMQKINAKLNNK